MKVRVARDQFFGDGIMFLICDTDANGRISHVALPQIAIEAVESPQTKSIAPTFQLEASAARELVDQLWDLGVRPSESRDRSEVVSAMREHISDLRRAAFDPPIVTEVREQRP